MELPHVIEFINQSSSTLNTLLIVGLFIFQQIFQNIIKSNNSELKLKIDDIEKNLYANIIEIKRNTEHINSIELTINNRIDKLEDKIYQLEEKNYVNHWYRYNNRGVSWYIIST